MKAVIIAVGDEVLTGEVVNTNSAFLSRELTEMGIDLLYHIVVSDRPEQIASVFRSARMSADLIILCGGLGPTKDDLTKHTVAESMGLKMVFNDALWQQLKQRFLKNGYPLTPNNKMQCYLPENSVAMKNEQGTAPGVYLEKEEKTVILFPGPPAELKPMFERYAKPKLSEKINQSFAEKYYMTSGIGESPLESALRASVAETEFFAVNTYLTESGVMVKAVGRGDTKQAAAAEIASHDAAIRRVVEKYLYSEQKEQIWEKTGRLLIEKNITVSSAESCTAGMFSAHLTQISGISAVFFGGVVSYGNKAKTELLGVKAETLERWGAVSEQTAIEMAEGARAKFHTDCAIAITGVAGPDGGNEEKPVGLVYICVNFKGENTVVKNIYSGNRFTVRRRSVLSVFQILHRLIQFD